MANQLRFPVPLFLQFKTRFFMAWLNHAHQVNPIFPSSSFGGGKAVACATTKAEQLSTSLFWTAKIMANKPPTKEPRTKMNLETNKTDRMWFEHMNWTSFIHVYPAYVRKFLSILSLKPHVYPAPITPKPALKTNKIRTNQYAATGIESLFKFPQNFARSMSTPESSLPHPTSTRGVGWMFGMFATCLLSMRMVAHDKVSKPTTSKRQIPQIHSIGWLTSSVCCLKQSIQTAKQSPYIPLYTYRCQDITL